MFRYQLPGYSPLRFGALLRSTWRGFTNGTRAVDELRDRLTTRFDACGAVMVGSGTQALQLALEHVGRKRPGLPVAIPAYSCFDIVTAAVGAGSSILFYDVDPSTLSPDLESLRKALKAGAGGVVVGNLYGFPLPWDAIYDVCRPHDVLIVEDAAQAIGSSWRGRASGSFGDLTVLSFGRGKGWTGGGGGALLARGSPAELMIAESQPRSILDLVKHAASLWAQWALGRPTLYGIPARLPWLHLGETHYRAPQPIHPMPALAAATIMAHECEISYEVDRRRSAASIWYSRLCLDQWRVYKAIPGGTGAYLRMPLLMPTSDAAAHLSTVARMCGVARGYPLSLVSLARQLGVAVKGGTDLPGARTLVDQLVTLPTHGLSSARDYSVISRVLTGHIRAR